MLSCIVSKHIFWQRISDNSFTLFLTIILALMLVHINGKMASGMISLMPLTALRASSYQL